MDPLTQLPSQLTGPHAETALVAHPRRVRRILCAVPLRPALGGEVARVLRARSHLAPAQLRALWGFELNTLRCRAQELAPATRSSLVAAPQHVRQVLQAASPSGVHVSLLQQYLSLISFPNADYVISGLLEGFPITGNIPVPPYAPPAAVRFPSVSVHDLRTKAPALRSQLTSKQLRLLREAQLGGQDAQNLQHLWDQTLIDIKLGRMSPLSPAATHPERLGTRRFGVTQRTASGQLKLRSIDDFAESLVNWTTSVRRRISMARITELVESARLLLAAFPSHSINILKSDFKAAYRSVPIHSSDLEFADVLVTDPVSRGVFASTQLCMPFGAVGAVYSWDWVSEAIVSILRSVFLLPVLKYVDDLFFAELSCLAEQSRDLLVEVVGLFGFVLSPDKTPRPSRIQDVLGVRVALHGLCAILAVDSGKVTFWLSELQALISDGSVTSEAARRLAGRLAFGCSAVWGRFPRARLSSLFRLAHGAFVDRIKLSKDLVWWQSFLHTTNSATVHLGVRELPLALLYTDAAGSGGIGAVLLQATSALWFAGNTSAAKPFLIKRSTQINAYELFTILVAVTHWEKSLCGQRLVFLVDNSVALWSLRNGTSSVADLGAISHAIWRKLARLGIEPLAFWVPSKLNVADAPSRGSAPLMGTQEHMRIDLTQLARDCLGT